MKTKEEIKQRQERQKEMKKISKDDPMLHFHQRREEQIQSVINDPSKLILIQQKKIRTLLNQWEINKGNEQKQKEIQQKIWAVSEHGRIGEDIIKEHRYLWKWWMSMKHKQHK